MDIDLNSSPENLSGENERKEKAEPESSCDENEDHLSKELAIGATFKDLDDVYAMYCEYARSVGFSVKKGTQAYFKGTLILRQKVYLCSCEGPPDIKRSQDLNPKYRKQVWRSNCKARLRVLRVQEQGPWTVSVFLTDHNHELIPKPNSFLLRSHRNLTLAKSTLIESLYRAGIGVAQSQRFMSNQAGGVQNVGFTKKDAYHHMEKVSDKTRVVDGDSSVLFAHLIERANNSPGYYWNAKTDGDGRLLAFYFRDHRCAVDYEYFGDVMSVDTTYRTNRYDLFCMPFIGVNHHRNNVMFGCGFISDETTKSFEWLLKEFLKSMNGKEPQIIFSDQCYALMNAVDNTFLTTSHRLCQWHINRNAASKIGKLNKNTQFKKLWDYLMKGCETGGEFEGIWKKMLIEHEETRSKWFKKMFKLRRRWSTAYTNMKFSAGLYSTQRSVSK